MKSEKIQRKASPGRSLLIMATACRHAALLAGAVLFLFFAAAGAEAEEAFEVGASGFGQVMEEDRTDESRDKEGEEAGSEDFKEFDSDDEFGEFGEFDSQDSDDRPGVYDPLSGYNRFMTSVNDKVYFWVLKPAATGYAAVAPRLVRKSVNRFFKNLGYPVRFVNNVLQLKLRRAGVETARFVVNTTIGLGGLADPAEQWM
ncbi:MAG: MlaA family lipoprotein, partial [Desulfosalsimonas sp.]